MSATHHGRDRRRPAGRVVGAAGLKEQVRSEIGVSGWRTVLLEDIQTFATLTGDQHWIHVDGERARTRQFGTTVQQGFLTLGMGTGLLWEGRGRPPSPTMCGTAGAVCARSTPVGGGDRPVPR
jgi:acyl dehydratase